MNIYHSHPKHGKSCGKINHEAKCDQCKFSRRFTHDSLVCDAENYDAKTLSCFIQREAEAALAKGRGNE